MATNGSSTSVGEMESSLEKIKKQLASGSGRHLLQGPLLKRSETLRKWNERWVILDPTTGKMEYKVRRNDVSVKGLIVFDSTSTITLSPLNFQGLPKYDGCCFYIGTQLKKEYFLCAETPGAARAWVSTLHATQLVLCAHKEAVNSLGGGNSSAKLGTVATVVAAANATAIEASKEIEAAMKISLRSALGFVTNNKPNEGPLDNLTIMKETLRVKDEEIQHLSKDIRARDSTIREIADKLTETASAAEAAASAALSIDQERKFLSNEIERLKTDLQNQVDSSSVKLREWEERVTLLSKDRERLLQQRDAAIHEAQMWRSELAKAREQAVLLEAAVMRAEEKSRVSASLAESRIKESEDKILSALREKDDLLSLVNSLQSQLQRQESSTKTESCSSEVETAPLTKQVDPSEEDKACLNDSSLGSVGEENVVQLAVDGVDIHSIRESEWAGFGSDVREVVSPDSSMDIPVVSQLDNDTQH